jgi:hypothetical protein
MALLVYVDDLVLARDDSQAIADLIMLLGKHRLTFLIFGAFTIISLNLKKNVNLMYLTLRVCNVTSPLRFNNKS